MKKLSTRCNVVLFFALAVLLMLINYNSIAQQMNAAGLVIIKTQQGHDASGKFSLQYPMLTSMFPNATTRDKVNKLLKKELVNEMLCDKDPGARKNSNTETSVKIIYASTKVLSFKLDYQQFCSGSAHPNGGTQYFVFDLQNGKHIYLDSQVQNMDKFSETIAKQFFDSASPECKQFYASPSELYFDFLVNADKIMLKPELAHAVKSCEFGIDTN